MADHSFIRPAGDWTLDDTPTAAEFGALDAAQKDSVSASGCTIAPSIPITIGGAGASVTGPSAFTDCIDLRITNAGNLQLLGGAALTVQTGGACDFVTGTDCTFHSGSNLIINNGAVLEFGSTANPTFNPTRSIPKSKVKLKSTTVAGGGVNQGATASTNPDFWEALAGAVPNSSSRIVISKSITSLGNIAGQLELPDPIPGATLASVVVKTMGLLPASGTPSSYGSFLVQRTQFTSSGAGVVCQSLMSGGAVADHHSVSGTWFNDSQSTTLTCNQNNVIDLTQWSYHINWIPPFDAGAAQGYVIEVDATYTVGHTEP